MEVINRENVQQIMAQQGDPMISIFMPTRKIGQAVLEKPIHLKNMIVRAEGMLRDISEFLQLRDSALRMTPGSRRNPFPQ